MRDGCLWDRFASAPDSRAFFPATDHHNIAEDGITVDHQDILAVLPDSRCKIQQYLGIFHKQDLLAAIQNSNMLLIHNGLHRPPYDILLSIDPLLLADFDAELGARLLNRHSLADIESDFSVACADIISQLIDEEESGPSVWIDQIRLTIRLDYLPKVSITRNSRQLFDYTRKISLNTEIADQIAALNGLGNKWIRVRGLVIGIQPPVYRKYGQSFRCNNQRCRNRNSLRIIRLCSKSVRYVKRDETGECLSLTTRTGIHEIDRMCGSCGFAMSEEVVDSIYSIDQHIAVADWDETERKFNRNALINYFVAILHDDLAETIDIGNHVELIGAVTRTDHELLCFDVNNLFLLKTDYQQSVRPHQYKTFDCIGSKINDFRSNMVGTYQFRKIRFYMLLCAASIQARQINSNALNFLVLVDNMTIDFDLIRRLMCHSNVALWNPAKSCSPKLPLRDALNGGLLDQTIARAFGNPCYVQLPRGGLKEIRSSLSKVIDKVVSRRQWAAIGGDEPLTISTNSCFWTAIPVLINKKQQAPVSVTDIAKSHSPEAIGFIDKWDLITIATTTDDNDIATHLLQQEISPYVSDSVLLNFPEAQFEVEMDSQCIQLVRECYLELRSMENRMAVNQLEIMITIALSSAKICCRKTTCVDDALVAAVVMEDQLATKFGVLNLLEMVECLRKYHPHIEGFKRMINM